MSTHLSDDPSGHTPAHSVADLLARERGSGNIPRRGSSTETTSTPELHVTELLRREGAAAEDAESAPPPTAIPEPHPGRKTTGTRAALLGKTAVLCGLTVGGLLGLQSTLAHSPDGPDAATRAAGASATARPGGLAAVPSTNEHRGGGTTPTTSAEVALKDSTTTLSGSPQSAPATPTHHRSTPAQQQAGTPEGTVTTTPAAPAGDTGATSSTPSAQPTGDAPQGRSRTPPHGGGHSAQPSGEQSQASEDTPRPGASGEPEHQSRQAQPRDDEGVLGGLLGTVGGLLDEGTDLLGL